MNVHSCCCISIFGVVWFKLKFEFDLNSCFQNLIWKGIGKKNGITPSSRPEGLLLPLWPSLPRAGLLCFFPAEARSALLWSQPSSHSPASPA